MEIDGKKIGEDSISIEDGVGQLGGYVSNRN